jgi:hypothetical protein
MSGQGTLFNSDSSGVNLTYMWFGQIVDESTWVENLAREDGKHSLRSRDDFQGYGYRYKVRIFGRDLEDKEKGTPDEELYMAEVSLPVTAGSGHGGSVQTPNLRQGNYVFGFYKDGVEATEPIIFGLLPNHAQTRLFGGDPDKGFFSRTGFVGRNGSDDVATKNLLGEGPDAGVPFSESAGGNYVLDVRDIDILKEQRTHYLPKTYACDAKSGGALSAIQKVIKDVQALINKIKAAADTFAGAVSDVINGINSLIEDVALLVTDLMKGIIDKMRGFAENILNKTLILIQANLPPNLTPAANEGAQVVVDILACVFNKIIKGLLGAVFKLLNGLLGKAMDTAQCLIESFMGSLLGGILGPIANALSQIGDVLGSILGGLSGIMSGIFNALSSILGIIAFLTCDEDADCSAGDGWSFWYGDSSSNISIPNLSNIIQLNAFSGGVTGGVSACLANSKKPKKAKPPKVKFIGGGGIGAIGNPIISPQGEILGVDIIDGGTGYTSSPTVVLSDDGPGSGTVLYARLENDNTFFGGTGGETSRNPDSANTQTEPTVRDVALKINSESTLPTFTVNPISPPSGATPLGTGEPLTYSNVPVNVGGNGGTPITVGGSGGNPLTYNQRPVTDGGTGSSLFVGGDGTPVITNAGPLVLGGTGGTPVNVGGNGGSQLQGLTNNQNIIASVDIPLFEGVENIVILQGPYTGEFNGRGTYENGSFKGNGTLNGKTNLGQDFSLGGSFSGFDTLLVGSGQGSFKGTGQVINSRFVGEGIFTADVKNISNLLNNSPNSEDQFGKNITTLPNGTKIESNPDGTGSITTPNGNITAVSFVKIGATSGSPVTVNGVPVILNGELATVGGNGGTILRVDLQCTGNLATSGGYPVQVAGINVCSGNSGIPLVAGANSLNSPAVANGVPLNSNAGVIRSAEDLGSSAGGVSVPGTFSGPDGSPIQEVVVIDPGVGYLPAPDGSIYADGVKFSNPEDTIIFDENSGYSVYPPNTTIPVLVGNVAYLPTGTLAGVYDNEGNELQSLTGFGQETGITIQNNGLITTPNTNIVDLSNQITNPSSSDGSYPVVLILNDVLIANPGINYSANDKIELQPNSGSILEPKYDKFGRLESVNIVNPGIGFTSVPKIFIRSNTGINAVIKPIFGVKRIGNDLNELTDERIGTDPNVSLIQIIDCVGKISRRP